MPAPSAHDFSVTVLAVLATGVLVSPAAAQAASENQRAGPPAGLAPSFQPPAEFAGRLSPHRSPLIFRDGREVTTSGDWGKRRAEILETWHEILGAWPPVLEKPKLEELSSVRRENFTQLRIRLQIAPDQTGDGYLLVPDGNPPFPAVFVPFYEPETSIGLGSKSFRDFAFQLTKRGFVTLALGSPGGDARAPEVSGRPPCQPLSFLGYICANAWQALANRPDVDRERIGIVGHSYGGKWSLFGSCLWDKFACAVWSDGGIVFDEARPNVNYWEAWYLGFEPGTVRKPGVILPRTGAYRRLVEGGHDLHELHALMAPRPFLVSGGSEDPPTRWTVLNHTVAVNKRLGLANRVAMTNRPGHEPNEESNAQIYAFFEWWLQPERTSRAR